MPIPNLEETATMSIEDMVAYLDPDPASLHLNLENFERSLEEEISEVLGLAKFGPPDPLEELGRLVPEQDLPGSLTKTRQHYEAGLI